MDDRTADSPLARLAKAAGVAAEYADVWGRSHEVAESNLRAILKALGYDASTDAAAEEELARIENARSRSMIETVVLLDAEKEQALPLQRAPEGRPLLRLESALAPTGHYDPEKLTLSLAQPLAPGVYEGRLEADLYRETIQDRFTLIVSPERGFTPAPIERGDRLWGVNLPLYAVRSARNWGVGDLEDLKGALRYAASLGADCLGLLPLHALPNEEPYGISPYYPWSRLWINAIYIALDRVPEFASPAVQEYVGREEVKAAIKEAREAELVEYSKVWKVKLGALRLMFAAFDRDSRRGGAFDLWREERGEALVGFAVFCALRGWLAEKNGAPSHWRDWPAEYRRFSSPAVKRFAQDNAGEVEFHAWLQWLAERQLAEVAHEALVAGMSVGLYLDLALGVDPGGPDAWTFQHLLALEASAGCPPDPFSLLGQDWGLPPVKPEAHREAGYLYGGRTLEANMRHAGALRIDHAAMLARLFWVPLGKKPSDGAYVTYPIAEHLALLRAISASHRCLVIGEDLGTVPEEVREGLASSGFFSYRLLMFEREADRLFKAPFNFPVEALISFATHDLPTLDGWWTGRDLEVKSELNRYPDAETEQAEAEEREADKKRLVGALVWQKLLPEGYELPEGNLTPEELTRLAVAVHGYMARAWSALMLVNMDDLHGNLEMQNLPGTLQEHPNWRRKMPKPVEEWADCPRAAAILAAVKAERGGSPRNGRK